MKLYHAAAVAFAGWYLIVPPYVLPHYNQRELWAPVSQWKIVEHFDIAPACESYLQEMKEDPGVLHGEYSVKVCTVHLLPRSAPLTMKPRNAAALALFSIFASVALMLSGHVVHSGYHESMPAERNLNKQSGIAFIDLFVVPTAFFDRLGLCQRTAQ